MKRFILALSIFFALAFVSESYVDARRGGGSRSRSSSSRSSSWGSKSKSSPSKSSGWGSKKTTTKKKSSAWGSKKGQPKATAKTKSTAKSNRKATMKKKQAARTENKAKSYAKSTTRTQRATSRANYAKGKTARKDVNYSNRYTGQQRTVVINRYNNAYGGYYYADPYNHSLIWNFSAIWWAHHWMTVDRSHYGNDARMKELEKEVAALRAKSDFKENDEYKDKDMDKAVMYSEGYLEKAEKKGRSVWFYLVMGSLVVAVAGGIFVLVRAR